MNYPKTIKPHKIAFLFPSLFAFGFVFFIFMTIMSLSLMDEGGIDFVTLSIFSGIFFVIFLIVLVLLLVKYKKTFYILEKDKIIYRTGTLFSDKEVELPIKNITHVKLQLPFIAYKFFKTGNVYVESAGSSSTEGNLLAIADSKKVYEEVQVLMQKNGFSIKKENLELEMKPSILGVVFDTIKFAVGSFFIAIFVLWDAFTDEDGGMSEGAYAWFLVAIYVMVIGVLIWAVFRYLDLRKRVYKVYDDEIFYKEGFLTKNYNLIPFENLTDSLSTQTIVDRMFGLYDVALSCQGAKKEIKFKNIVNGDVLSDSVKKLLKKFRAEKREMPQKAVKKKNIERVFALDNVDTSYREFFKMNKLRALFLPITLLLISLMAGIFEPFLFIFSFIFILVGISGIITYFATTYKVGSESMTQNYKFLKTRKTEFLNEKITSVILEESWLDKLFGTCKIKFGSIGSASKIYFKHLKKTENLEKNILSKFGFQDVETIYKLETKFTFGAWFLSSPMAMLEIILFILFFFGCFLISDEAAKMTFLVLSGFIFIVLALSFIYLKIYYKKSGIFFDKDFMMLKKGFLIQTKAYANYKDVKDIESEKYPLTLTGSLNFNVAGEDVVNQELNQKKIAKAMILGHGVAKMRKFSHGLALKFVGNIPLQNNLLDKILQKPLTSEMIKDLEKDLSENKSEPEMQEKPSVSNVLFWPILIMFIGLIPVILSQIVGVLIGYLFFCFIIILIIVWIVRAISFEIDSFRVIKKYGIIYKKQTSILFSKIDNINKSETFTNKIFKNGNIGVFTKGSSKLELGVDNLDQYKDFYERLKSEI